MKTVAAHRGDRGDLDAEIQDANLGLIASTARLLEEADKVRRHRDRLMELIRQRPPIDVAEVAGGFQR